ncbi:hypothetical protein Rs2_28573 [Raphanus sativus]|nr:hypothetical protein Rs2_28573 [Raphanus sativus]
MGHRPNPKPPPTLRDALQANGLLRRRLNTWINLLISRCTRHHRFNSATTTATRLDRLQLYTAGATPKKFRSPELRDQKPPDEPITSPFSTVLSSRRSVHRTSRSPPPLNRLKP